jgi:hypothetical protein
MVDKVGGYIRFFDPATDKELASFQPSDVPGIKPHDIAISDDHKTAYVSVYGDGVYGNMAALACSLSVLEREVAAAAQRFDVVCDGTRSQASAEVTDLTERIPGEDQRPCRRP